MRKGLERSDKSHFLFPVKCANIYRMKRSPELRQFSQPELPHLPDAISVLSPLNKVAGLLLISLTLVNQSVLLQSRR